MKVKSLKQIDEYQGFPLYALSEEKELTECELKEKNVLENDLISAETKDLSARIIRFMTDHNLSLSVSESLTGGELSSTLISQSGASKVFVEGIVAYSNNAKCNRLNVSSVTLDTLGAVSAQTALEMAKGVLGNSDYSLSTTGLAGPAGDGFLDKVGTVYIGLCTKTDCFVKGFLLEGERNTIRNLTVNTALSMLLTVLIQNEN